MMIPLFDLTKQFETTSGTLNVGGYIKVFRNGTDDLALVYEDLEATTIKAQPIRLDAYGRAGNVYVAEGAMYRLEVYSRTNALLWTIEDMQGMGAGGGGGGDVTITSSDSSINVEKTGSNYDLTVHISEPSVLQANSNSLTTDGPFTIYEVTKSQGRDIWLDNTTRYIRANQGWYHVDFNVVMQNTTARNQMLTVGFADNFGQWHGAYLMDLSYTEQRCESVGFDIYITENNSVFQIIETDSGIPSGITFYLTAFDMHSISGRSVGGGGGGGTEYIAGHGIDISGPMISVDNTVVQDKLVAGDGITINQLTNTISADKEIVYVTTANTYQDVCDIIDSGKMPVLKDDISAVGQSGNYTYEVMTSDLRDSNRIYFGRIENQSFEGGIIYFVGHICYGDRAYYWSSFGRFIATTDDLNGKMDKVSNSTGGDIAVLDGNGQVVDSHSSISNVVFDPTYVHTDNNFTTALKDKLDGIAAGAEVNVQADWNESDSSADSYIQNKPDLSQYDDVVIYNYGTGKISDIGAAVSAGKVVIVGRSTGPHDYYGFLSDYGYGAYTFTYIDGRSVVSMKIQPDGGDGTWSISAVSIPSSAVNDVEVNGTSVVNAQGVAEVTVPVIGTITV